MLLVFLVWYHLSQDVSSLLVVVTAFDCDTLLFYPLLNAIYIDVFASLVEF